MEFCHTALVCLTLPSCVHTQEYLPVVQAAIVVGIPKYLEPRKIKSFYNPLLLTALLNFEAND
jgi:vancomycin permeability regulator SanA